MTTIAERLAHLSVAHLCDACLRVGIHIRIAPPLAPIVPGQRASGRVRPVRHAGSVDVFLEALERSSAGEVLVVDNDDRDDEGCLGDLTALEVSNAGLRGIVIWGRHRDTAILRAISLPLFSKGACGRGPVRLDARDAETFRSARIGGEVATPDDWAIADDDGVLFVADAHIAAVAEAGEAIRDAEARQVALMGEGVPLRAQLRFDDYVLAREADPGLDFRAHLRGLNAAIEE